MNHYFKVLLVAGALAASASVHADEIPTMKLAISNQAFTPAQLTLPAGVKVKLLIRNTGTLPAEFESYDLSREVVVPSGVQVTVYVGPLQPGRYKFFNDFNHAVQGWVVVDDSAKR